MSEDFDLDDLFADEEDNSSDELLEPVATITPKVEAPLVDDKIKDDDLNLNNIVDMSIVMNIFKKYIISNDLGMVYSNERGNTYIWFKSKSGNGGRIIHNGYLFGEEGLRFSIFNVANMIKIFSAFSGKVKFEYLNGILKLTEQNSQIEAEILTGDEQLVKTQYNNMKVVTEPYKLSEDSNITIVIDESFVEKYNKITSIKDSATTAFVLKKKKLHMVVGDNSTKMSVELDNNVLYKDFEGMIKVDTENFKKILSVNKGSKINVKVNGIFYILVEHNNYKCEYISKILV